MGLVAARAEEVSMKRIHAGLVVLVVVAACTEQPTSTTARVQGGGNSAAPLAAPQAEYVATPRGWYHRSCVHEIPAGAQMDAKGVVTRRDGSTYQIPRCGSVPNGAAARAPQVTEDLSDWVEWAQDFKSDSNAFRTLTAQWLVPSAPTGSYPGGTTRVYYAHPALESEYDLLMPALAYGYNGSWGGAYWTMTSWYFNPVTGWSWKRLTTNPQSGDSVYAMVSASGCSNGQCTWRVIVGDSSFARRGVDTLIVTGETGLYRAADGGVVQVLNFTACNQFPPTGVYFYNISMTDTAGTVWPASWSNYVYPYSGCYLNVMSSNYDRWVKLYHTSLLSGTSISVGPSKVRKDDVCIWGATIPTGGVLPYTYTWTPPGTQEDNYVTESWGQSGTLRVQVSDSLGQTASAQKNITVDSTARVCPRRPVH
jgi:hypothetical protein